MGITSDHLQYDLPVWEDATANITSSLVAGETPNFYTSEMKLSVMSLLDVSVLN